MDFRFLYGLCHIIDFLFGFNSLQCSYGRKKPAVESFQVLGKQNCQIVCLGQWRNKRKAQRSAVLLEERKRSIMLIYQKDRRAPVRLFDDFSELKGLTPGTSFHFQVCRDEYYVVQLLLCECSGPYTVVPRGLDGRVTIYNTQGIDKFGRPFAKPYETQSGRINPLYIGVDFSGLAPSSYSVSICLEGVEQAKVSLTFQVTRQRVANHGYDDL